MENLYNPALYESVGCTLQAHGDGFEPKLFLREAKFDAQQILLADMLGVPDELKDKVAGLGPDADIFTTPFLLVKVSEARALPEQLREATAFLHTYQEDIQKLKDWPQVASILLQFIAENGDEELNSAYFSDEFLQLAAVRGIEHIPVRCVAGAA